MYSTSKQHTAGNVKDSSILMKIFVQSLRVKKNIKTLSHQYLALDMYQLSKGSILDVDLYSASACDAVEEKDTERGRHKEGQGSKLWP
jgi:hypothetical protein